MLGAMSSAPAVKSAYAYQEIRARISDGRLPPGARLRLRALGVELGLSEMPVREALRMLQRDGMVDIQDHRGATVTEISLADVLDQVSTRMWLEILAVECSVPLLDAGGRKQVEQAFGDLDQAAGRGDSAAFSIANRRFHEVLEARSSTSLTELIQSLWDRAWIARRQRTLFGFEPGRMERAQAEHRLLMEAAFDRDPLAARAAMSAHREATIRSWSNIVQHQASVHD